MKKISLFISFQKNNKKTQCLNLSAFYLLKLNCQMYQRILFKKKINADFLFYVQRKKIEETLDILATQKIVENKRNFILFTIDNNLINQPNTNFIILLVKKKK